MTKTIVHEGYVKLASPNGIKDTRTGDVYSEAVVKESDVKYFAEAE